MKLALLSFHNAANYGAAMQAYALQKFLEKKGFDCEYLDYVNHARKIEYSMFDHIAKSIKCGRLATAIKYMLGTPFMELRKMRFNKFYRRHLNVSKQTYTNPNDAAKAEPLYDKFVVGSDQVWCAENNGGDVAFLLSFVKDNRKKISYSSSFGRDEIPKSLRKDYAKYLNDFTHLSTRESFGCDLIKRMTGRDATLVLDPVFLLSAEDWRELIIKHDSEKFIFSYTNTATQLPFFLKQTKFPLRNRRIYKLSSQTSPSDFISKKVKVMYTMSPQTFLQSVHDAEFVVTASFHCLAFSIIFHKPFAVLLSGNGGKTGRLSTLLEHLGLTDRVVTENTTYDNLQKPIDWKAVDNVLNEKRKVSINYLIGAITDSRPTGGGYRPAFIALDSNSNRKYNVANQNLFGRRFAA